MKKVLRVSLSAAVLVFAGWYVTAHPEMFAVLRQFDWAYLPGLVALVLLSITVNGQVLIATVRPFGIQLLWREWFGLTAIGSVGNYAPIPQAGPAARALYLKKIHGLAFSSYAACVLVVYAVALAVQGIVGMAGVATFAGMTMAVPWPLLLIFASSVAVSVSALLAPGRLPKIARPVARKFQDGLRRLSRRGSLATIAALMLAQTAVATVSLYVAFAAIHQPVSVGVCLLLTVMILISGVFNLTPGNIGVAESAAWLTAALLGGDGDLAVVAYAVYRAVSAAILFTLGPIFTLVLSGQTPNHAVGRESEPKSNSGGIAC